MQLPFDKVYVIKLNYLLFIFLTQLHIEKL